MRLADEIQELFEEAMREVDRLLLTEIQAATFAIGNWIARLWPRMPCEGWQDELDSLLRDFARSQLFITDQSRADIIAWVTAANEEAKRDALLPGGAGPRLVDICYGPRPQPAALKSPYDKPAPIDPRYPELARLGHVLMEQFPPADWLSLGINALKRHSVPEEIKKAFVQWIEGEQRKALGTDVSLPPGTPVGPDGKLYEVCVAAGTPITTRRGKIAVELVTKGDEVLVADQREPGGPLGRQPVTEVYHNKPAELMSVRRQDGEALRVTPSHKLYVRDKGWVAAAELASGDLLRTDDDRYVPVTEISRNGDIEPVFNLCVAGSHTYFAGGVLVHNDSPAQAAPAPASVAVDVPHLFRLQKNPANTPVMFKLSASVGANGGVTVDLKEGKGFDRNARQGGFPFDAVVAGAHTGDNATFKDTDSVQVAVRAQDQNGNDVFHETNALPQGMRPFGADWTFTGNGQQQNMAASWATKGTLPASAVRVDVIVLYTDARHGAGAPFGGDYSVVIGSFTATRKNPQSPWAMTNNAGDVVKPVRDRDQPSTPQQYAAAQQKTDAILLKQTGYRMKVRPPSNGPADTGYDITIR